LIQLAEEPRGARALGRGAVQGPSVLFRWYSRQCDPGYDFCGWLEFCSEGTTKFGYRLPGVSSCEIADAPLIRMLPGKKYQMTLRNLNIAVNGSQAQTNVHTHGLHISGDGNADDMTRFVDAGNCLKYNWTIPDDHMGGTFWYHPHRHTLTQAQVSGGAFGMLIIEEQKNLLKDLRGLERRRVQAWLDNELLLIAFVKGGGEVLGNGKPQEDFEIVTREWYRLRVAAVNPFARTQNLVFHPSGNDCEVRAMAYDGVWRFMVPSFASKYIYPLTGASRIDLAVRCSGTQPVQITYNDDVVAILHLEDGKATAATPFAKDNGQWYPDRPKYLRDLQLEPASQANKFLIFMEGRREPDFNSPHFINNETWDKDKAIASFDYNELQEWTIRNSNRHPFHLHLYHQQLIEGCEGHHEVGQYYDTISASGDEDCKVRFVTKDIGGRTVFHCHITAHSDRGMMNWVDITGGPEPGNIDVGQVNCSAPPCRETGSSCLRDKDCCVGSCESFRCQA